MRPPFFMNTRRKSTEPMNDVPLVHYNQGHSLANALSLVKRGSEGRVRTSSSHVRGYSSAIATADIALPEPTSDPETDEASFAREMAAICSEGGVSLLVPQRGALAVARNMQSFHDAGVDVLSIGGADTIAALDDKATFTMCADRAGLPVAWTREVGNVPDLHAAVAELRSLRLDACIKPPIGVFGSGYHRIVQRSPLTNILSGGEPAVDLMSLTYAIDAEMRQGGSPSILVCEHLPGDEWSVDAVCESGETIVAVARRKRGPLQEMHVDGEAMEVARRTIEIFGLSGLVNVQMKTRRGGGLALLEVNPRMSGGCYQCVFAGVNLPWIAVGLRLGMIARSDIPAPRPGAIVSSMQDAIRVDGSEHPTFSSLGRETA